MNEEMAGRVLNAAFPQVGSDDPSAYIRSAGDIFQALAFAYLIWPKFAVMHGAVFICYSEDTEKYIDGLLKYPSGLEFAATDNSWQWMVDNLNTVEVYYLFGLLREPREMYEDAVDALSEVLKESWASKLRQDFSDREFRVYTIEPDDSMSLRVAFTQVHPDLQDPAGWRGVPSSS